MNSQIGKRHGYEGRGVELPCASPCSMIWSSLNTIPLGFLNLDMIDFIIDHW